MIRGVFNVQSTPVNNANSVESEQTKAQKTTKNITETNTQESEDAYMRAEQPEINQNNQSQTGTTIVDQNQLTSIDANNGLQAQQQIVQQAMASAVQTTIANSESKSIKEVAKDLTYLKSASDLQNNESFKEAYDKEVGTQLIKDLKDEGVRAAIQANAKKLEEKNIRNQAFFEGCQPIFKLLGITAPYGLFPMLITVILLMIPFLAISLVIFVINSINSVFEAISGFKKPAFVLCTIIMILGITCAALLGLAALSDAIIGTDLLHLLQSLGK